MARRRSTRRNPYNKQSLTAAEVVVFYIVQNLAEVYSFDRPVLRTLRGALSDIDHVYDRRGGSGIPKGEKPAYDEAHSAIKDAIEILAEEERRWEDDDDDDKPHYRKGSEEHREKMIMQSIEGTEGRIESLQRELEEILSQGGTSFRLIKKIEEEERKLKKLLRLLE